MMVIDRARAAGAADYGAASPAVGFYSGPG